MRGWQSLLRPRVLSDRGCRTLVCSTRIIRQPVPHLSATGAFRWPLRSNHANSGGNQAAVPAFRLSEMSLFDTFCQNAWCSFDFGALAYWRGFCDALSIAGRAGLPFSREYRDLRSRALGSKKFYGKQMSKCRVSFMQETHSL